MDQTRNLDCQTWVACSPLMGMAIVPYRWYVSAAILGNLLACSYQPDAFTVVVAVAKNNI